MNEFIEVKAGNRSTAARRSLVYGHGLNDAWYKTYTQVDGKQRICPYYRKWASMIKRAYDPIEHANYPQYTGTTVCKEWYLFSTFRVWMEKQDWKGRHLDKDIVNPGSKHYSPDNCCFISAALNTMLTAHGSARGEYPQGVSAEKAVGKFRAQCNYNGNQKYLGCFNTATEAAQAYNNFKSSVVRKAASEQSDPRIRNGLEVHANLIERGIEL